MSPTLLHPKSSNLKTEAQLFHIYGPRNQRPELWSINAAPQWLTKASRQCCLAVKPINDSPCLLSLSHKFRELNNLTIPKYPLKNAIFLSLVSEELYFKLFDVSKRNVERDIRRQLHLPTVLTINVEHKHLPDLCISGYSKKEIHCLILVTTVFEGSHLPKALPVGCVFKEVHRSRQWFSEYIKSLIEFPRICWLTQ